MSKYFPCRYGLKGNGNQAAWKMQKCLVIGVLNTRDDRKKTSFNDPICFLVDPYHFKSPRGSCFVELLRTSLLVKSGGRAIVDYAPTSHLSKCLHPDPFQYPMELWLINPWNAINTEATCKFFVHTCIFTFELINFKIPMFNTILVCEKIPTTLDLAPATKNGLPKRMFSFTEPRIRCGLD